MTPQEHASYWLRQAATYERRMDALPWWAIVRRARLLNTIRTCRSYAAVWAQETQP